MNKLKLLKITLLTIILAEEINSVNNKKLEDFKVSLKVDTSEIRKNIENLRNGLEVE